MDRKLLEQDVLTVAPLLLGWHLRRTFADGSQATVRIVEVEAYRQNDAASHSYRGKTPRTEVMFGPAGFLYVYFTYGMHYCCNVVTGPVGEGAAVLIRAVEPVAGQEILQAHRHMAGVEITNGPAKLCQALTINRQLNGHNLADAPLELLPGTLQPNEQIMTSPRIGIKQATDKPWRFYIAGNPYVSGPKNPVDKSLS